MADVIPIFASAACVYVVSNLLSATWPSLLSAPQRAMAARTTGRRSRY